MLIRTMSPILIPCLSAENELKQNTYKVNYSYIFFECEWRWQLTLWL